MAINQSFHTLFGSGNSNQQAGAAGATSVTPSVAPDASTTEAGLPLDGPPDTAQLGGKTFTSSSTDLPAPEPGVTSAHTSAAGDSALFRRHKDKADKGASGGGMELSSTGDPQLDKELKAALTTPVA